MNNSWPLPEHLQRLYYINSVMQNKSVLNIGAEILIKGPCKTGELQNAFTVAVGRHDAFNIRIKLGASDPECRLLDNPKIRWRVESLGDYREPIPDTVYWQIAEAENIPFSLEDGALVRGTLYSLGKDRSVLAVTAHHLVADAWTIRVLVEDILIEWRRIHGQAELAPVQPGSLLKAFGQTQNCTAESPSDCSGMPPLKLPLDNLVHTENLNGNGNEVVVRLESAVYWRFRQQCAEIGQTLFAGIAAALFINLAHICDTPTVDMGIVMTMRDLRRHRRTAGCFVQVVPVSSNIMPGSTLLQVVKEVGHRIRDAWKQSKQNHLPSVRRYPVMVSMVRDASARLAGPTGVSVQYKRRRRTQAESDLHVFIYDHTDSMEIVFNFDSDKFNSDTVKSWGEAYLQIIEQFSETPNKPIDLPTGNNRVYNNVMNDSHVEYSRLQHIGLAAWELDIGLRRLSAMGFASIGHPWEDDQVGATMALAGSIDGLQFEVVAPIRRNAPCVGTLVRDGEGPYHCCWRVSDMDTLLDKMDHFSVKHHIIQEGGKSDLFPCEGITFVIIDGIGLVEFLFGVEVNKIEQLQEAVQFQIYLESEDLPNARRFLQLLGYRQYYMDQDNSVAEIWNSHDAGHRIYLSPAVAQKISKIAWADVFLPQGSPATDCLQIENDDTCEMATTWWARFQYG